MDAFLSMFPGEGEEFGLQGSSSMPLSEMVTSVDGKSSSLNDIFCYYLFFFLFSDPITSPSSLKRKRGEEEEERIDCKVSSSMPFSENSQSVVKPSTINTEDLPPEPMALCKVFFDMPQESNSTMTSKEPGYIDQCNKSFKKIEISLQP